MSAYSSVSAKSCRNLLQLELQALQLLLRIRPRVDFRVRLRDLSVLVDHVGDPPRVLVFRRVGRAVRDADLPVGVAEERVRKVVLLREFRVVFDAVEADADDLRVLLLVFAGEVPEPGTLGRSASGVRLRIEPEDEFLAAEIAQLHMIAVVIERLEIGSGIAHIQHSRTSKKVLRNIPQAAGQ
jgi:hypothetical protein